jgi:hypothetical protein
MEMSKHIKEDLQQLLQDSMAKSGLETMALVSQLKKSLINNTDDTMKAYNRVLLIYTTAFIVGLLLITTAIVFGAMGKTILAIAFGTIGLIDIVTYFIKMPANKIQESRSNISQLQVILLVWLNDLMNNTAVLAGYLKTEKPTIDGYKDITTFGIDNAIKLLKLIEELAEPKI